MFEPTEKQKERLTQCPECSIWRNKFILECSSKECLQPLKYKPKKRHLTKEQEISEAFKMKKLKELGHTNQEIAEKFGYACESTTRRRIGLLDKYL